MKGFALYIVGVSLLLLLMVNAAQASLIGVGTPVSIELGITPIGGGPFDPDYFLQVGPNSATIGPGLEFSGFFGSSADFGIGTLDLTFNSSHSSGFGFNGFIYRLTDPSSPDITNVSFLASNISGFDASRVSFNADAIAINLDGLSANGFVQLGFTGSGAVIPEPTTFILFSFGLVGMFGFLRKRRKA